MRSSFCRKTGQNAVRSRVRQAFRRTLLWSMLASAFLGSGACTRAKYRYKTNKEAYYLIDEKTADAGVQTAPYRIEVNPESRFFDPFNPDRPPMPEDDPVANNLMKMVDRKKGYPLWEANGRTNTAENPQWWSYLPLDERGVLVLTLDDAVRTALLHSPAYQQNLETMYLSAIDVSSERFLFDSQFFTGWGSAYTADGYKRSGGGGNSNSTFTSGPFTRGTGQGSGGQGIGTRGLAMRKRYASGTDFIVGLANSMSWQFSGPNNQSTNTILDFALIQPFLRQGGRDVVLERLTLAERTLLSNVRAFERYRRGFYIQIATGGNAQAGPVRRGGVAGGAGLDGFTGLGGGFGTLGQNNNNNQGAPQAATPGAGGFLGLLQQQLTIINTRDNIVRQRDNLNRLEDTSRELLLTIPEVQTTISQQQLQVAQQRQSLFSLQTNLLAANVNYEQTLDTFKRSLGLPPYLCIEIRDPLLDQFNLISPELRQRRDELNDLREEFGKSNTAILELSETERDPVTREEYRKIGVSDELNKQLQMLRETIKPLKQLETQILEADLKYILADIVQLEQAIPTRRKQMERLANIVKSETDMVCGLIPLRDFDTRVLDVTALEALPNQLRDELQRLEKLFRTNAERSSKLDQDIESLLKTYGGIDTDRKRFKEVGDQAILGSQDLIASMAEDVLRLQVVQALARTESVLLPEVDIEPRDALEIARLNRRDWINNRAALVNSWRAIEVVADDLESVLDFVFSGDIQNLQGENNPLALRSATGRLRVGLQWDAPITRLQERNRYRQALIEYQQAKRSYYQFEDSIWLGLRATLRGIRQNQLSFEIQRYAVRNAANQVSINEDIRLINETLSQASGPTAARDAVSALTDLLNSQGLLIGVFVQHEALRRSLDLDLGTSQLDADGVWIDPGPIRKDTVGGQLGPAILNYGLNENEQAVSDQLQAMDKVPVEFSPTNRVPSDAQHVYGPAEPGLIEGPIVARPMPLQPAPNASSYQNEMQSAGGRGLVGVSPNMNLLQEPPNTVKQAPLPALAYPEFPPSVARVPQSPVAR